MKKEPSKSKPAKVAKKAAVAKKEVKKVAVKKAPVAKKEKVVNEKAKVTLVSFAVSAVIPTQQFGNIQPRIEVTAPTYEEARAYVMPLMEELYAQYAEMPLNGRPPRFLGKVTETEKVVDVKVPAPKVEAPATVSSPAPSAPSSSESTPEPAPAAPAPTPAPEAVVERPAPFLKAQKAIQLALGYEALDVIEKQISESIKIDPADKPELLRLAQERRNELPF